MKPMQFLADDPPPPAAPEWLLTYGDLMSLLLTFFILLAAMTDVTSEGRVAQAIEAMQRRFGKDSPGPDDAEQIRAEPRPVTSAARRSPRLPGPGRSEAVGDELAFVEASAELAPREQDKLHALAESLQGKGQRIEIRGHTTRRPLAPGGPFADHWELAFARCRTVERLLLAAGIDPNRLRMSVAAGNEPAYVGDELLADRGNSRVEVFLLDEFAGPNEETAARTSRTRTAR
jgi:chemotaxis protein MotB